MQPVQSVGRTLIPAKEKASVGGSLPESIWRLRLRAPLHLKGNNTQAVHHKLPREPSPGRAHSLCPSSPQTLLFGMEV